MFIVEPGEFWLKGADAVEYVANATAAGYNTGLEQGIERGVDIGKTLARKETLVIVGVVAACFLGYKLYKHFTKDADAMKIITGVSKKDIININAIEKYSITLSDKK